MKYGNANKTKRSDILEHNRSMILSTLESLNFLEKDCIYLDLSLDSVEITESKVGGVPYLPKNTQLPQSKTSGELRMIAQLNLEEMASSVFPIKQGILQFWGTDDPFYGMDSDDISNSDSISVVYYPKIEDFISETDFLEQYSFYTTTENFPVSCEQSFKIQTSTGLSKISTSDFRFNDEFVKKFNAAYPEATIEEWYDLKSLKENFDLFTNHDNLSHKLLGYPNFTQSDPREGGYEDYILLFQLDSQGFEDSADEIMWGDCGVATWLIHPEDLKKADFSKVLFYWDAY